MTPAHKFPPIRRTARTHIDWKLLRTYKAVYRSAKGDEITVRSVRKPTRTKVFRSAAGRRKYKLVRLQSSLREVIIVAKTKNRKKPVDAEEIEELEALEELEEDEDEEDVEEVEDDEPDDEDEDEDEDEDDDDEEEEEAPKKSKSKGKKSSTKSTKAKQSRAAAEGKVGTSEVAEHFGIDGRTLRMLLRKHQIPTDPDSGRYQWSSLQHKQVVRIGKLIKSGEAKRAKRESLDKLKEKKAAGKATSTKKGKTSSKKKSRKASEDEDDE